MNYNLHRLFRWNQNNILYNETTNKYTDVYLQTGSINLEKTVENFEWHNSLCYTYINNELKIIDNSNHFIHHIDYGVLGETVIYNKIVRNYYEFIKNYNVTPELFNNTLDESKLYFYMIDSFVFTNSGHNLSVLLDQIQYIIDNNIKDILILKNSQNTNNFKLIKLLIPTDCVVYELDFNTIYKIKNIIIIFPEFYNIYKHANLISQLKDKIYNTYKEIYNDCFNKNIILIKKKTLVSHLKPPNCSKLISCLISKNWIDIEPENIDVFKMCIYLLTAKNIICSDGSIVYTNKIFINNNGLVFGLVDSSYINYENFRSINNFCSIIYNNETLNSKLEVFRITNIIESNLSPFYILDNKRLSYIPGNETYINMDKSYGSYVDSFEEALNICKNNKNCKQIVYNKKDKYCFPMTQWHTNLSSSGINDEEWISAYRYDYGNLDKVAIIIPTYNRFNLLKKTLESAINQTYKNIDIFVTDDNSFEYNIEQFNYMIEMQQKYNNITYINNKENKGFCKNINTALKLLTKEHEYFHILFDDDWIEPEYIETAVNVFKVHKNISFVEFRALNHISKEQFTDCFPYYYSNIVDINFYMKNVLTPDSIITSCVSPCNRVFKNLGIFFEENTIDNLDEKCLRNGSGYDFIFIYKHLKIYKNFFYYSEKPLCNFLSHDGSESCNNTDFVIKNTILGVKWCINDYYLTE